MDGAGVIADNEDMDWLNWLLIGVVVWALMTLFRKKDDAEQRVSGEIHVETRKKATALLPLPDERADGELFTLEQTPMRIKPTAKVATLLAEPSASSFEKPLAEGLWLRQREMLERLEGELEMHQQAELSVHFAIAAPTNQPADLLTQALVNAEKSLDLLLATFEVEKPARLWMGRALILMLSNRKLFDHVAWLAEAGLTRSQSGAYLIGDDGVVLICVYATRVSDSRRIILKQIVRSFLYALGGSYGEYPRWIEEGIARWMETERLGAPQPPAGADGPIQAAAASKLIDDGAWKSVEDDPIAEEAMLRSAGRQVEDLLAHDRGRFITLLHGLKASDSATAWQKAFGKTEEEVLARALASKPGPAPQVKADEGTYIYMDPPPGLGG